MTDNESYMREHEKENIHECLQKYKLYM
jgi:hypothetical protein